jgi:hypothetical protein
MCAAGQLPLIFPVIPAFRASGDSKSGFKPIRNSEAAAAIMLPVALCSVADVAGMLAPLLTGKRIRWSAVSARLG